MDDRMGALDPARVPMQLKESLLRYATQRIQTGAFLRAVLENDLTKAVFRADAENVHRIPAIVAFVENELPAPCWGSKEKVDRWLSRREIEVAKEEESNA